MKMLFLYIMLLGSVGTFSQDVNRLIGKGNEAYRLQQYDQAAAAYREALKADPGNAIALFNLGNALFKDKKYNEAANTYDEASKLAGNDKLQSELFYNKGVALTHQKKLEESIAAYKQALRINTADTLARENLQRALNEKQQQQNENRKKEQKENENRSKPRPNKLNKQQVEQLLKALEEQERKLQDKKLKKSPAPQQPEKDW